LLPDWPEPETRPSVPPTNAPVVCAPELAVVTGCTAVILPYDTLDCADAMPQKEANAVAARNPGQPILRCICYLLFTVL
jgi:hypothetical protein